MVKVSLLLLVAALTFVQAEKSHIVGNRTVTLGTSPLTFFDADFACKRDGQRLFAPRNEQEIMDAVKLMKTHFTKVNHMWVGFLNLHMPTKEMLNLNTGDAINKNFWTTGEHLHNPKENCVIMTKEKSYDPPRVLSEVQCSRKLKYFCESCLSD